MRAKEICRIAYSCLVINEQGDMRICRDMEPIGNIKETTPQKAWSSKKAEEVRKKIFKCNKPCKILNCNYIDHE